MKLTFLLMFVAVLQVSARVNGQGRVSLSLKQVEISKALNSIEKQGDFRFLYNSRLNTIRKKITIDIKDKDINEALNTLFNGTDLRFKILANNLIVVLSNSLAAQDIKITGKITGDNGEALSGVSITLKGTSIGTTTDNNGVFTLVVPEKGTLVISDIGFETQEVAVNSQSVVNVKLTTARKFMDEVVVIGYGQASKRDLTGSIVKIDGKEVADKPNTNPIASLQGKVAGLSVVNTGALGQQPDIRIRGTGSITQTKPLYVVDGLLNDDISFINPSDIESIEVLKDASSLAIFGVRGANGVIIITTKKGKGGQLSINFNTSVGVKKLVNKIKLTNATDYKTLYNENLAESHMQDPGTFPDSAFDFSTWTGNSDWINLISQNGIYNANNLSLTSGTDRNRFYMGLGYTTEEGIIKHEMLKKLLFSVQDELKASKNIKVGFSVNASKLNNPQGKDFTSATLATPVVVPFNTQHGVYNRLPNALGGPQIGNPLLDVDGNYGTDLQDEYRFVGNVYAEISFLRKFTFRASFMGDVDMNFERKYTPNFYEYYQDGIDSVQSDQIRTAVFQKQNRFTKFQQDYLLSYKSSFGKSGITLLGGFTTYYKDYLETNGQVSGTLTNPIPWNSRFWYLDNFYGDPASKTTGVVTDKDVFGDPLPLEWQSATISYLGRALYNFDGKYLINASFRRDGSSDISPANRYQNFEAVGAAWQMDKEKFMENQHFFDVLKVKGSWGILGNQYTSIHYAYDPILVIGSTAVFGSGGGVPTNAFTPAYIADPNLKWETITTTEGGVEFGVMQNRLHGDFDYYNRITNNLLTNYPALNGAKPGITNAGKISNKGVELSLAWSDKISKDLSYTISGNLSTISNKVISVYQPKYQIISGPSVTEAGQPIASFYGYVQQGIYQSSTDTAKSAKAYSLGTYGPGDIKYKDLKGTDTINSTDDRTIIGNPTPKIIYAFSFGINYKGLDLSIDFQGVGGNQIFRNWGNGNTYAPFNYRQARLGRWHGEGTSNTEPEVSDAHASFNELPSTYMIESGAYLRIRNLQLGYTLPLNVAQKMQLKSVRIYVSGQNIATFKHNSGFTPEFGGDLGSQQGRPGSSALQFGVDGGSYPIPAIYTAGLNVTF